MAYTRVNWENYPSTNTPRNATNLNKMDEGLFNQDARITVNETEIDNIQTGWNLANETWTYSSVDDPTGVITISGDVTTKYSLGMRIKFTNGGNTIYGIITKISYSSPNTTLTFLHEINPSTSTALHLMANSAITNNYYSNMKVPYGFPLEEDKWSIITITSSNYNVSNPTANTWYYMQDFIQIPIGNWKIEYTYKSYVARNVSGELESQVCLSTSQASSGPINLRSTGIYANPVTGYAGIVTVLDVPLYFSTKTNYYLNGLTSKTGQSIINKEIGTKLIAICAYL